MNIHDKTTNKNVQSGESILDSKLPCMNHREQLEISGANKRYHPSDFAGVAAEKSSTDVMKQKYPLATTQHIMLHEYYKTNDLSMIRLPPKIPRNRKGEADRDPRLTLSFKDLSRQQKLNRLERYAKEVKWYFARVSRDMIFANEVYSLKVASYRIFAVLKNDPFYQFDKLSAAHARLLFGCCVEWFMRLQQRHVERKFLKSAT